MDNLIKTFKEGWLDEDPRIVCAVLLAIGVFVTLSILLGRRTKKKNKLKDNAIKNGTVIQGRLTYHYTDRDNKDNTRYYGRYAYTVNGEKKEYSVNSNIPLPDTIELYPKNSMATKFFSDYDRTTNAAIPLNAIISVAVLIFTLCVTGYFSL
ncbi:MAG: hypothetical protein IJA12_07535 [Oscillospiraceae bacterium]|nr:hypothetical protein [Oscillospiraceae bacterium]